MGLKRLVLLIMLLLGLFIGFTNNKAFANLPPNPGNPGVTNPDSTEPDDEDGVDDEDDEDDPDPDHCPVCGRVRPGSIDVIIPFGRMVHTKLIPDAKLFIRSDMPSPKLFTPQGLYYEFNLDSYIEMTESSTKVIRPNGFPVEYDSLGYPQGRQASFKSRAMSTAMLSAQSGTVANDQEIWMAPASVTREFANGSKAVYTRYVDGAKAYYKITQLKTAAGRELTGQSKEIGIEVIRDSNKVLRQIKSAADGLADIVVVNSYKYEIRMYSPEDIGAKSGSVYTVNTGATPYCTWTIENPQQSDTLIDKVKVTKTCGTETNIQDWEYLEASNTWKVSMGSGTEERVASKMEQTNTTTNEITVTDEIRDYQGNVVTKKVELYGVYDFGKMLKETTFYVDSSSETALKNTKDYYTDENRLSCLRYTTYPTGNWQFHDYDSNKRTILTISPLKNLGYSESTTAGEKQIYSYIAVATGDTVADNDDRPRTITVNVAGVNVSKKYKAYIINDTAGERTKISEVAVTPSAVYGAAGNLRTTKIYDIATGRLKSVTHPDGRKDTYTYDYGIYTPGSQTPGTFTVNPLGYALREIIVHGTTSSPNGIAYKSTKEITVHDQYGNKVLHETYAYDGSNYNRVSWTVNVYNVKHQITNTYTSRNTTVDKSWTGDNPTELTGKAGIEYVYTYDTLDRLKTKTQKGVSGSTPDIVTTYTYNADDKVISESVSDGANTLISSKTYDFFGQVLTSTDSSGLTTSYSYTKPTSTTGRIITTTYPDGSTEITEYYFDNNVKSITGTAVIAKHYDYGVESATGYRWTKESIGSATSSRWTKTYTNAIGKVAKIEESGYNSSTVTTLFYYNSYGQLYKKTQTDLADTLYVYDDMGSIIRIGLDINANGTLDLASNDRINETETVFSQISSDWWLVTTNKTYATNNSDTATTTSISKVRFTGLASGTISEMKNYDINNNETVSTTNVNRTTKTVILTVNLPDSSVDEQIVTVNGLVTSKRTSTNLTYTFSYDGLGRRTGVTDPRTGNASTAYYTSGTGKIGKVYTVTDAASNTTTYDYSSTSGRLAWVQNALSKKTYYDYNTRGQVTKTWGDTGYPIEKGYDSYGQMTTLKTYRTGTGWTGSSWPTETTGDADTTTWAYDTSSGLITSKTFADSNSVNYTYTTDGKLYTRAWARTSGGNPLTTTYSYDSNTGEQTGVDYSDSTQDITFSYTRTGQKYQVTDAVGTRTFAYNSALQPTTETIVGGLYNKTVTYDYATTGVIGRYAGLHIGTEYDLDYGYDTYGRFSSVTNGSDVYTYGYLANSDLVSSITYPNTITATNVYETNRDLVDYVENKYGATVISKYDYTNDAIGRRTAMAKSGTAFTASDTVNYTYNDRSELTSADATTDTNYNFAFNFDNIGNRNSYTTYETGSSVTSAYTANSLNQYTAVNDGTAYSLSYDNDGNITSLSSGGNSLFTGTSNAENRLISVESADTKLEFKYDYMGRRVEKKVYSGSTGNWTLDKHLKFVYDEFEQIEELDGANSDAILKKRIWGMNKLVADIHSSTAYYALGDANKNITEYLDSSGNIQAHYEYSPFGKITSKTGSMQNDFDYRFSCEVFDSETDLVYYNFRYYSPTLGRWLSRDPIEEEGGWNLYGMCYNNSTNWIDLFGFDATKDIKKDEGYSNTVYTDTKGKKTIGYGFNLDRPGAKADVEKAGLNYDDLKSGKAKLSKSDAEKLLKKDIKNAQNAAKRVCKCWDKIDNKAKDVLTNMAYQMGGDGLSKFKKMLSALKKQDYKEAAKEMLDSKWAKKDTPNRAKRLAKQMSNIKQTENKDKKNTKSKK